MVRVAILDDYQQVALKFADWSPISGQVTVDVFTDTLADEDQIVRLLEKLPNLRCTGLSELKYSVLHVTEFPYFDEDGASGASNVTIERSAMGELGYPGGFIVHGAL
ncbi:hypothetical protein K435DRAFT_848092 [Dendrothele bispora CBS 962.96]|uniref:Uncharacterized protein n=1 Tax=Dendrothele bispora (strain CBS 962.96) TaxID=1314807 RepID=A0A4S8MWG1_DENBC|nr:hypothetical protein K435DRAFT_848092 [Dendrothele bispora CBS 962.96]